MRNYVLIACAACLIGLAAGVYSCSMEREIVPDDDAVNQTIERAQRFFETEIGTPSLPDTYYKANSPEGDSQETRANLNSLLKGNIKPDWKTARVWENDRILGTEVAARLKHPVKYAVQIEDSGEIESETVQSPYVWVIFNEDKKTGKTVCFVASLLPDASYSGDVSRLGSNPEGSDFWGVAIYSSTDGIPLWGQRFEEGEITNSIAFDMAYEDQADPNVRIFIGILLESVTRALPDDDEPKYGGTTDPAIVVGKRPKNEEFWINPDSSGGGSIIYLPTSGAGGGGGGGGGGNSPSSVAAKAKKLFKNTTLTETQWKELEKLIEKIMADCMGGMLYNNLAAKGQFQLQLTNNSTIGGSFSLTNGITLSGLDGGSLFHEMFHAWQSYQETGSSWTSSSANRELEAYLAEYRYAGDIPRSDYRMNIRSMSDEYISPKGAFTQPANDLMPPFNDVYRNTIGAITQQYRRYGKDLRFDDKRLFNRNFQNLQHLSKNC
jgi:hypothetical protein